MAASIFDSIYDPYEQKLALFYISFGEYLMKYNSFDIALDAFIIAKDIFEKNDLYEKDEFFIILKNLRFIYSEQKNIKKIELFESYLKNVEILKAKNSKKMIEIYERKNLKEIYFLNLKSYYENIEIYYGTAIFPKEKPKFCIIKMMNLDVFAQKEYFFIRKFSSLSENFLKCYGFVSIIEKEKFCIIFENYSSACNEKKLILNERNFKIEFKNLVQALTLLEKKKIFLGFISPSMFYITKNNRIKVGGVFGRLNFQGKRVVKAQQTKKYQKMLKLTEFFITKENKNFLSPEVNFMITQNKFLDCFDIFKFNVFSFGLTIISYFIEDIRSLKETTKQYSK